MKSTMRWMVAAGIALAVANANAQQAPSEAYQKCIKDNEKAHLLSTIVTRMIEIRDQRKAMETALDSDPKLKAKYKSVDEMTAEAMQVYRQNGGTAKTLAEVMPMVSPCASLAPKPVVEVARPPKAVEKAEVLAPAKSVQAEKPAAPVVRSRSHLDARECLKHQTNKAIMACAEKFR